MSAFCPGFGAGFPGMSTSRMSLPTSARIVAAPQSAPASGQRGSASLSGAAPFLDPRYAKPGGAAPAVTLAARAQVTLGADAVVGLLDISKAGGSEFLGRVEALLRQRRPLARIVRHRKPTFNRPAPDDLRKAILTGGCTHVAVALAD